MALYLIAFNDEWVPDLTTEEVRERGTSGRAVIDVPDEAEARYWAGRVAIAVGWPQEVHRFPHRLGLSADTRSEVS